MITVNVFQKVFLIKYGDGIGTCFALDWNECQYLVTARHVVGSLQESDRVEIFHDKTWKKLPVALVGHGKNSVDISVLVPSQQLGRKDLPLPVSTCGLIAGQDLYFVGFPYGLKTEVGIINRGFPLPLIKKGILSAITKGENGEEILLLDGHNNRGFSGGPVVFSKIGSSQTDLTVAGVVSAYHVEIEQVFLSSQVTQLTISANTGIVISYSIKYALEIIEANPIGIKLN